MESAEDSVFRISSTVRALSSALRGEPSGEADSGSSECGVSSSGDPGKLWFKESSAKNLRNRDFLAPAAVLRKLFPDGQVPDAAVRRVRAVRGAAVLPLGGCEDGAVGLRVRADRPAVFRGVLHNTTPYLGQGGAKGGGRGVVLNCPALHPAPSPQQLSVGQLRTILIADHLGALCRRQGFSVSLCPVLEEGSDIIAFLQELGVDWPTVPVGWTNQEREAGLRDALMNSPYSETGGGGGREEEEAGGGTERERGRATWRMGGREDEKGGQWVRVDLKRLVREQRLLGYDPNLSPCPVQQEGVAHLAQLQAALSACEGAECSVLHVSTCQQEIRQQQLCVLWRAGGASATQKLLVCGPVKPAGSESEPSAAQYLQLRRAQMREASEMKYGEQMQGQTWGDIIRVMTSATVRFDLLSTAHHSPVTVDVGPGGCVSTKGGRGGVFVLYNCARLATLFSSYDRARQQGLYPDIPDVSQLDFATLKEEGEWLLLFNYIIPFPELLDQSGEGLEGDRGLRVSLGTEAVCRFLVSLSMNFSSYYNRVHILGEPLPHLFSQMFSRLQLLSAVRELFHSALDTLHIPPLSQL
ncbi:DALR anticodon-binding domain-containing protein 3 [Amia ocellicauda]|uniref:DALR anticodon-binding domain-containing protein 3 n=1 Tax=Amia ocellicauda TaxID=2972642 RepID=UPI0034647D1E